jgi:hypothetical protein
MSYSKVKTWLKRNGFKGIKIAHVSKIKEARVPLRERYTQLERDGRRFMVYKSKVNGEVHIEVHISDLEFDRWANSRERIVLWSDFMIEFKKPEVKHENKKI